MNSNNSKKSDAIFLGIRKVSRMNFSKLVTLPKQFTDSLDADMYVSMQLEGETLKISPAKILFPSESEF